MMRITFTLIACLFIVSCAVTPNKQFPNYVERAKTMKDVDVLLDIVISSDIEGDSPGIDLEQHITVAENLTEIIHEKLKEKGYSVNKFHTNSGLFLDNPEEAKNVSEGSTGSTDEKDTNHWVFSKGNKSTNEIVTGPFLVEQEEPWTDPETRSFLKSFVDRASQYYSSSNNSSADAPITPFLAQVPSTLVEEVNSGNLIVLRVQVGEVSGGKTAGSAILTGLLTAALTGGAYIAVSAPISSSITELAVLDVNNKEILWYNMLRGGGPGQINNKVVTVLNSFHGPASTKN